jgi:hypothetical protein
MRILSVFVLLIAALTANAATIIDFDSVSIGSYDPLIVDGFRFEPLAGFWDQQVVQESPGDNALFMSVSGNFEFGSAGPIAIMMTAVDGNPFAFYGADFVGEAFVGDVFSDITGNVFGGGGALGPIGTGDWLNLEAVFFDVSSTACCGQPFETLSMTIDNVNANVVPIPAAVWLFGSGLGLLGWFRRRVS